MIITETGRYKGILDSNAIIRILGEKKISTARDQNPLSGLPGNASINAYLSELGDDVRPFYKEEHLEQNCIYAKGRNGRRQKFPILTVSAALIWLGGGRRRISPDLLAENISKLKRRAKKSNRHIAEFRL